MIVATNRLATLSGPSLALVSQLMSIALATVDEAAVFTVVGARILPLTGGATELAVSASPISGEEVIHHAGALAWLIPASIPLTKAIVLLST